MQELIRDRKSALRVFWFLLLGLALGLTVPGSWRMWAGIIFVVFTATALGLATSRTPPERFIREQEIPAALAAGLIWAGSSIAVLAAGRFLYPDLKIGLLSITLPNAAISLRSVFDIGAVVLILAAGVYLLFWCRGESPRIWALGAVLFTIVAAYCAWKMKIGGRYYSVIWADEQFSEGIRYLTLFDLCNALWLGCIIPLLVVRETLSKRASEFLECSLWERRAWRPLSVIALLPLPIGLAVNTIYHPGGSIVDSLPAYWWLRKCLSLYLWTAAYEEVTYRITCFVALESIQLGGVSQIVRTSVAAVLSVGLYTLAHGTQGWAAMLGGAVAGSAFILVLLCTRNIGWCILSHALIDVFLVRWN